MLVKRYLVKDMQQAMDMIIKELGSDAVILNSRKVRQKGFLSIFKKRVLEVMVAYDPEKIPSVKLQNSTYLPSRRPIERQMESAMPPAPPPSPPPAFSELGSSGGITPPMMSAGNLATTSPVLRGLSAEQLSSLDSRITSIDELLNNFMQRFSYVKRDITYDYSDEVMDLVAALIENQVEEELVHSLAKETDAILKKQETSASEVMEHLIREQLGEPDPIAPKKFQQKIVLFIGATGVGKTTSLVKLAADFSIAQKKKVGIINTDTYRIAAQEQLKTYADILGIPLSIVYQMDEMDEAVAQMADRDVIFIDTAGKRPGDEQHQADIVKIIDRFKPEDILLCISASTSFSCIKEWINTYGFVDAYKLVVTKLDETRYRGILLNLCWHTKRKLAYVTTGQNVPDDIEVANTDAIAASMLKRQNVV